ncbi:MAG: DUF2203 family protein [Planctomycetota bacterium]
MTRQPATKMTLEEANRRIPLLSRIVQDAMTARENAEIKHRVMAELTAPQANAAVVTHIDRLADQLERWLHRMESCSREVEDLGGSLHDIERGEVRFPGVVNELPVQLSWRFGETRFTAKPKRAAHALHERLAVSGNR